GRQAVRRGARRRGRLGWRDHDGDRCARLVRAPRVSQRDARSAREDEGVRDAMMRAHTLCLCFLATLACRPADVLRVCADPNNMPFSNARQEGFENKLASLVANEMHARVEYT